VLVLLVIVLLLLYNRYRLRARNAASEKQYAEEKLKYARQLLQNFTENNRQKNELIEQFSIELQRLKSNMAGDPLQAERLNNFEKLVQSTILTDTEWKNFRELFNKVHKGFFTRIEKKLPGLSLEEIRLVSLIRLGLSNLEIGNMMGIQADAVQAAKQKLLHKIHPVNDGITIEGLVLAI
jgi:DNA-binding CsgD family transcriptional regulator